LAPDHLDQNQGCQMVYFLIWVNFVGP
jgi:hypothetical protein